MARYLIDSNGRVWDPFDQRLLAELGDPDPDYDLVSYAVRNLGFVEVSLTETDGLASTTVRYRQLAVTAKALAAAAELISQLPPGEVKVISGEERWTERRFDEPATAFTWFQEESASAPVVGFKNIAVVPQDLGRLSNRRLQGLDQNDDRLALLFKKWRITSRRFSYDVAQFMVNFGLFDRATLARPAEEGTIVWHHLGDKLNMYERDDKAWHLDLVGRPVAQQRDENYGAFVQTAFQRAIVSGEPRLDHVDAVIRNQRGSHRSRYDRLILPWTSDHGGSVITTLSYKTDPDLDVAA